MSRKLRERGERRLRRLTTYLDITKLIKVHFARKLLLNRPRARTTRPPPQIIAPPILILLGAIQAGRHTPDDQIPNHDNPAKRGRNIARGVRLVDAKLVAEDGGEVEQHRHGGHGKVHPRGPGFGVARPGSAVDGFAARVGDGPVRVLRREEFDERHGYGDQDGDGDAEGEDAGDYAEAADAGFELLGVGWSVCLSFCFLYGKGWEGWKEMVVLPSRLLTLSSGDRGRRGWQHGDMLCSDYVRRPNAKVSAARSVRRRSLARTWPERVDAVDRTLASAGYNMISTPFWSNSLSETLSNSVRMGVWQIPYSISDSNINKV